MFRIAASRVFGTIFPAPRRCHPCRTLRNVRGRPCGHHRCETALPAFARPDGRLTGSITIDFSTLQLAAPIVRAVTNKGYTVPTDIQAKAIPPAMAGRDLLGTAQTGTGKTGAFALPILHRLSLDPQPRQPRVKRGDRAFRGRSPRALVLCPTRELATQIHQSFMDYGSALKLYHTVIYGGVNQFHQVKSLQQGVDVLVATPGRLKDLHEQGFVDLSRIQSLVLDEADRMLDMGFINDIRWITKQLPGRRQTLLFSATISDSIRELAHDQLRDPVVVETAPESTTVETVNQRVFIVDQPRKPALLINLLQREEIDRTLIFARTKHKADRIVHWLRHADIHSEAIHSNKTQNSRNNSMRKFRLGYVKVLVATDIASRGIDVEDITHVINFDMPIDPETYVHRIGRTARAGASGTAITFCEPSQQRMLRAIEERTSTKLPPAEPLPDLKREDGPPPTDRRPARNQDRRSPSGGKPRKPWAKDQRPASGGYGGKPWKKDGPPTGGGKPWKKDGPPATGGKPRKPWAKDQRPASGGYGGMPWKKDGPPTGGGKPWKKDGPSATGGKPRKPWAKDQRPASGGYGGKPWKKDGPPTGGGKPWKKDGPPATGGKPRKPWSKDQRPASGGYGGKPWKKDGPPTGGGKPWKKDGPPAAGGKPRKPWAKDQRPASGGYGGKPWKKDGPPAAGGKPRKPWAKDDRAAAGSRGGKPWKKGGPSAGGGKPWKKDGPPSPGGKPRKPWKKDGVTGSGANAAKPWKKDARSQSRGGGKKSWQPGTRGTSGGHSGKPWTRKRSGSSGSSPTKPWETEGGSRGGRTGKPPRKRSTGPVAGRSSSGKPPRGPKPFKGKKGPTRRRRSSEG